MHETADTVAGDPSHLRPADPVDVVLVGGGVAGLRTVAELRDAGFTGSILLVGEEADAPYDRTLLSVTWAEPPALAEDGLGDLAALDALWWAGARVTGVRDDAGIAVVTVRRDRAGAGSEAGAGASAACPQDGPGSLAGPDSDRPVREVTVRARRVVAASGAMAAPAPWPGAVTLRTAADARALRRRVGPGTRLVVVGAGWVGAELAGTAVAAGAEVTVVELTDLPLAQAPDVLRMHVVPWFEAAGVDLVTGTGVASMTDGLADARDRAAPGARRDAGTADHVLTLTDGRELRADVVLAALGAVPSTRWLRGITALTPAGHVLVDAGGRAIEGPEWLWAVGDAAATDLGDRLESGGHWEGALHHPAAVAASIVGRELPPRPAPYVYSDLLGRSVAVVGSPVGEPRFTRADDAGVTWLWTDDAGRLLAGATADHPRDVPPLRRALAGGNRPMLDLAVAADPARRLRDAFSTT